MTFLHGFSLPKPVKWLPNPTKWLPNPVKWLGLPMLLRRTTRARRPERAIEDLGVLELFTFLFNEMLQPLYRPALPDPVHIAAKLFAFLLKLSRDNGLHTFFKSCKGSMEFSGCQEDKHGILRSRWLLDLFFFFFFFFPAFGVRSVE